MITRLIGKKAVTAAVSFAVLLLTTLSTSAQGPEKFNPKPKLPYDATTLEQDAWVAAAEELAGDGVEEAVLTASRKLLADATAPLELRRWAACRLIEVYGMTGRGWEAISVGGDWLAEHPEDSKALDIRLEMAKIVSHRRNPEFQPSFADLESVYESVFSNHDALDWRVIKARLDFCLALLGYQGRHDARELQARAREHLTLAEAAVHERLARPDNSPADEAQAESLLRIIIPAKMRVESLPPAPAP
ncbi:MAG TPA: hypothetical protein PKI11_13590 [Candidatus Hydrogenedentes bacterium]|nr:hypothetical protein [Candidatus Hydrogenedentota bacterium]